MLRHLVHVILAVFLWVVFVLYWRIVLLQPMNPETMTAMISLAAISFLTALYLTVWMFYNIRLFHRFTRRKARRTGLRYPIQDYMGRWIVVDDPKRVNRANYIEVEVRSKVVEDKTVQEKIFLTTRKLR